LEKSGHPLLRDGSTYFLTWNGNDCFAVGSFPPRPERRGISEQI
jgi:hypothetical protein